MTEKVKVTELKNEGLEREFKVVIAESEISNKVDKQITNLTKTAKIAGFRPGKVPLKVIKNKYGKDVFENVVQETLSNASKKIVDQQKLKIATQPKINDLKKEMGKDLEFTMNVEFLPEIELPKLDKYNIEKPVLELTDKDVDKALERVSQSQIDYKKARATSKAKKNDRVIIDFEGFVGGEAFEGGKGENHKLVLGSNTFIPGFEDQLIGAKAGDEITVKVTFPEEYHAKDLAGKEAEFKTKVNEVQSPQKAEMNDEFAKKMGFETVAELREKIAEQIKATYNEQILTIMKMNFFNQLEDSLSFEAPKTLLKNEFDVLWQQSANYRENDPSFKEKSDDEVKAFYEKVAARRVKIGLMLSEYARENKISVTQHEMQMAAVNQAKAFPGQEQEIIKYLMNNPKMLESLTGPILEDKAVRDIFDKKITLKEKKYKLDALDKLIEEENKKDLF